MRVDYTLPALQPDALTESTGLPAAAPAALSFRDQMRGSTLRTPNSLEQQLRANVQPFSASYIGPPPQPKTMELSDAETVRSRWHSLVRRHADSLQAGATPNSTGNQSVQGMLQMLADMQQAEDAIVSKNAAVTRG